MIFGIILLAIAAILLVWFVAWFIITRVNGNCPLCAMEKIARPSKLTIDTTDAPNYGGATVPPMGWSSWNTFRQNINQDLILEVAEAMEASGLAEAGYNYINLDDCWHSSVRDEMGRLQGGLGTFSMGIPALIKQLNSRGFKVGLYSSNGNLTCEDLPASLGHERLDAKTLASWGCEFFKYDFCHHHVLKGDVPIIENLQLNLPGTTEPALILLPGEAEFTGKGRVVKCSDLPSGQGIGMIGYGSGTAGFRFSVEAGGTYALTLAYNKSLCFHQRYLRIRVNNGKEHELLFPTTKGASPTGRIQLTVELQSGENHLLLYNPVVTRADSSYLQYARMGRELQEATKEWAVITGEEERPIIYSICEWGFAYPYKWGAKAGNMWRTTPDIMPKWLSIKTIYEHNVRLYDHAGPGAWNDPDMLEVGNGKLTENENRAHFSLWCMMAAPLILGNDVRKFVDGNNEQVRENPTLKIVTNKNLINIDQDPLCKPCKRIRRQAGLDILARPLQNGDVALCLFNKGTSRRTVTYDINALADDAYLNFRKTPGKYEVHELWSDEWFNDNTINATVPHHGVKVYRIHNS